MVAHRECAKTPSAAAVALEPDGFSRTTRPRRPVANRTTCRLDTILHSRDLSSSTDNNNSFNNNYYRPPY